MATYIDLNDLGSFASINALWAAFPEGGQEGDYCTIDGVKYRWDKYDRMWVADPNFGPTPARRVDTFYSDVNMQNNLTVAGYIRAKGIKQPCLGYFLTEPALKAKWPDPEIGAWALVGDSFPATVWAYQATTTHPEGEWVETEATAGPDDVDLSSIVINGIKGWVVIDSISDLPSDPTEDEKSKGYLLDTILYVWDSTEGTFKSAQLKGDEGEQGPKGDDAIVLPGEYSAYIADNLTTDDSQKILSAKQGKVLNDKLYTTVESQGEQTTFDGNNAERTANKGIINDGSVADNVSNRAITPYLEIYPLSTVTYLGFSSSDTYGIAFYDEDKNFIAGSWHNIPNDRAQTFTAPEGACFVRGTIIGGTSSSYVKYYPIVRTPVEAIPQLDERITALEEGGAISVVDNLESSSATDPLSANQGRVIGGCIYVERQASSQTTIGQADATHNNYGIGSDGLPSNSGNLAYSKYTDFTKIAGGSTYKYSSYAPAIGGLAFYAEANEASFISFVASPAGGGAKSGYVPNNAKYFRVTFTAGSSSDYFKYYAVSNVPVNQAVDDAMAATQPFIGKRIAILGDSITWLSMSSNVNRGWVTHFRELLKFAELRNYARSGATWSHTASTQYDITEDTTSISNDNVIYNQVNRLINDVDNNGVTAPDYIFILAGTNDAWYPSSRPDAVADTPASVMSDESVWLNVKTIGSLTSIPKAMRYVAEMIWNKFPNCQVVVTTPLQSTAFTTDRREAIANCIKGSADYLSWGTIEQDKVCDISRIREHQGYYMTYDGTHTSEAGAKMVGEVLASQLTAILGR